MVINFKACLSFLDNIPGVSAQGSAARDNFIPRKQVYNWWDVCILDTMLLWSIWTIYTFLLFFYFLNYQRVLILNSPFQKEKESHTKSFFGTPASFLLHLSIEVLCKGGQAHSASSESCSTTGTRWKVTKTCHGAELNALIWCPEEPLIKKEVLNPEIIFLGAGLISGFNNGFMTVWRFLKNLKIELLYDPAIPFYIWKRWKLIQKDTCTPMFIAALFIIAKI